MKHKKKVEVYQSPGGIITFIEPGKNNASRDRGFFGPKIGTREIEIIADVDSSEFEIEADKSRQGIIIILAFALFMALVLTVGLIRL